MKNIPLFLLLALATLVASCGDDDVVVAPTTNVNLNWKAVWDTDLLVFQNNDFAYKYPDGKQVRFTRVNFFISDVVLLEADGGDEVELIDVEFVDFTDNSTLAEAQEPVVFSAPRIPVGNYKGIRIGFGVPAELNNSGANQFGADHPLRKNFGEWWEDWKSFIFTKINGQYDENGDGIFNGDDPGFSHHLGSDAVYRTITIDKNIVLEEGMDFDLNLVLDLKKFYARSDSEYFDMTDPTQRHTNNPNDLTVANYLVENFGAALTAE